MGSERGGMITEEQARGATSISGMLAGALFLVKVEEQRP
jgi:hypothetical protein